MTPEDVFRQHADAQRIAILLWGCAPHDAWNPFLVPSMDAAIRHRVDAWADAPGPLRKRWPDLRHDFMVRSPDDPAASWGNCGVHAPPQSTPKRAGWRRCLTHSPKPSPIVLCG